MSNDQTIGRETCASGWVIVRGSDQAREMARAAVGETWRTAWELSVLTLATDAPVWAEYPHNAAWGWLASARGRERVHPIAVEARKRDGEWEYRASGPAKPLPRGRALVAAVRRRLDFAIDCLEARCEGGAHPGGHTRAAIKAVPTIEAARTWLAENEGDSLDQQDDDSASGEHGPPRQHDQARKDAVEDWAMDEAVRYFAAQGWRPDDVSDQGLGYDIRFARGGVERHVEVKGTTASGAQVHLFHTQVEHARECADAALFVQARIEVSYDDDGIPVAAGGVSMVFDPWIIDDGELASLAYSYRLPQRES